MFVNNLAAGKYTFSAVATDNLEAKTANMISPTVNAPPTASITSPANNASFVAPGNISVTSTAVNPVTILNPAMVGSDFVFSFASQSGTSYDVQYRDSSDGSSWQSLMNVTGNGSILNVTNRNPSAAKRFYRVAAK